jgi:hypothetical protein
MNNSINHTVLKRKGHGDVFAKIQSLALTHPDKTVGDLESALNDVEFARQCDQALIDKGECPIGLNRPLNCQNCNFGNPAHCGWNEFKAAKR